MDRDVLQRHQVRVSGCGERALLFANGLGFDQRACQLRSSTLARLETAARCPQPSQPSRTAALIADDLRA